MRKRAGPSSCTWAPAAITTRRRFQELGPDTGFDSIGDWPQADALGGYLDRLDQENALPKMVLYNLNPADNYVVATMVGNFQDGSPSRARSSSAAAGGSSIRRKP